MASGFLHLDAKEMTKCGNDETQTKSVRVYHRKTTYDIGVIFKCSPQEMTESR